MPGDLAILILCGLVDTAGPRTFALQATLLQLTGWNMLYPVSQGFELVVLVEVPAVKFRVTLLCGQ